MQSRPLRILLVEDVPEDALIVQTQLAEMTTPVDVTEAVSLESAVRTLAKEGCGVDDANCGCRAYDLVLLDLHLPNGSGLACIRRLRKVCSGLSLVVLTRRTDEHIEEYFSAGADDFLEKGGSTRQLEAVIYRAGRASIRKRTSKKKWQTINQKLSVLERFTATLGSTEAKASH